MTKTVAKSKSIEQVSYFLYIQIVVQTQVKLMYSGVEQKGGLMLATSLRSLYPEFKCAFQSDGANSDDEVFGSVDLVA